MIWNNDNGIMSPKKCVFGCEGKITLLSIPKNPVLREQWMQFVFPGHQQSFTSVFDCSRHFGDECFINKAHFDTRFANLLKLKEHSQTIIDPGYDSELQAVSQTASNFCFVSNRRTSAHDSLAPSTTTQLK